MGASRKLNFTKSRFYSAQNNAALPAKKIRSSALRQESGNAANVLLNLRGRLILPTRRFTMYYVCFDCGKKVEDEYLKTRVRCPYCGGKILYKDRRTVNKVLAR